MKRVILLVAAILLVALMAMAQNTPAPAPAAKPMQTTPAMSGGDTGDMQATMSKIAADKALRMQMVQQLITAARTDSAFRHEMVGAMMADKDVHATMMHMHQGEKGAMMKHETKKEPAKETKPAPTPTTPGK